MFNKNVDTSVEFPINEDMRLKISSVSKEGLIVTCQQISSDEVMFEDVIDFDGIDNISLVFNNALTFIENEFDCKRK